jgi:hypothetical protein
MSLGYFLGIIMHENSKVISAMTNGISLLMSFVPFCDLKFWKGYFLLHSTQDSQGDFNNVVASMRCLGSRQTIALIKSKNCFL